LHGSTQLDVVSSKDIPFLSRKVLGMHWVTGIAHTELAKLAKGKSPSPTIIIPLLPYYSADRELGPLVMMTSAKHNRCCGSVLDSLQAHALQPMSCPGQIKSSQHIFKKTQRAAALGIGRSHGNCQRRELVASTTPPNDLR
jgi:hypothetical protein